MNRSNFLKSLATLIAAPSVIAEIKEPMLSGYYKPGDEILKIGDVWITKADWELHKKWQEDRKRAMWFGSPTKITI